jgi:DNA polymerase (family 10)
MKNREIAGIFYEMADILEMQNVEWKPRAYRQAAKAIESYEDIEKVYRKYGLKGLEEIPGVGENLAEKIAEFLKTGKIDAYEKLKRTVPSHINVLMKIPGMGPKKVRKLNELLKITNVKQLEKAAHLHKIASVPGFGEKSEKDILENISLMKESKGRIPLKEAEKIANKIIMQMKKLKDIENISSAGSVRRKKSTIRDVDIIASSNQPEKVIDVFTKLEDIRKVLAKGHAKAVIVLKSGLQIDLRVFEPKSWGAGLLYLTGNKNYNIELRKIAIKKGCKLNEYGLFGRKTGKMIAGKTEQDICKKLGARYLEPEQREK